MHCFKSRGREKVFSNLNTEKKTKIEYFEEKYRIMLKLFHVKTEYKLLNAAVTRSKSKKNESIHLSWYPRVLLECVFSAIRKKKKTEMRQRWKIGSNTNENLDSFCVKISKKKTFC